MFRPVAILLALSLAAPLWAEPITRAPDRARLDGFEASFGRAVKQALAGGAPEDIEVLVDALAGGPGPLDPAGDWACRTMKLGGLLPLVVYTDFQCRITETDHGRWQIEKLTGSQRMAGTIEEVEGEAVFHGVGFVKGGPATDYAGLPPEDQTPVEPGQTVAEVGYLEQMGPDRARLLLPAPILESDFDILYLTR